MNLSEIPYNMKFTFGPNLREIPVNKMDMLHGMMYIQNELRKEDTSTNEEKGNLHGTLGSFLRIIGELDDSERHIKKAISIAENTGNIGSAFYNKLRLAHTHQWKNEFDISNRIFRELIDQAEEDPDYSAYLDFAYEHQGKNLFDQGKYDQAIEYFQNALDIRKQDGNEELIKLTESAIESTRKKQNELDHNTKSR
ncbi:tetratricopeptide repeat protein [Virgibacillus kekensis]|uniref:Tetratricopeptide repeat protein n=1 Tax=Virgibacillus kekensis TaxID=202261 RepID=A0ABV9DNN6_9BACI